MKHRIAVVALLALFAISCGSSPSPAPETGGTTEAASEQAPAAPDIGEGIPWAEKSKKQKGAFMKAKVVPAVAAIWKDSPDGDGEVTCATCHGRGAMEGKFEMPTDQIPALNPADSFAAHKDEAAWLEFMGKKLVPTMAQTLGVDPYNPETQKGFGCFACHTMETGGQ